MNLPSAVGAKGGLFFLLRIRIAKILRLRYEPRSLASFTYASQTPYSPLTSVLNFAYERDRFKTFHWKLAK